MRIVYIAKHDSGGNDDEGAITHALTELGHDVQRVREDRGVAACRMCCDFMLFHHWNDLVAINRFKVPRVFWYFDLVKTDDPLLHKRIAPREAAVRRVTDCVDLGFLSDGDWVNQDTTGKLVWMTQGVDERTISLMEHDPAVTLPPILFTGSVIGERRQRHIEALQQRYTDQFSIIGDGVPRLHGGKLAYVLNNTRITIAPDGPSTDNYWSNRVYLTTGMGGFLLHPSCSRLREQYSPEELVCYDTREHLFELIDEYLEDHVKREKMRRAAYSKTVECHLYRHRCAQLISTVQERLKV